jgi:hypothetical protein
MNIANAALSLGYDFETEILPSKNTLAFLHDQDPKPNSRLPQLDVGRPNSALGIAVEMRVAVSSMNACSYLPERLFTHIKPL